MKTTEEIENRIEGIKEDIAFQQARIEGCKRRVAELAARGIMDFGAEMDGIKKCEGNIAGLVAKMDALEWALGME